MNLTRTYLAFLLSTALALMGCTRFDPSGVAATDADASATSDVPSGDPCLDWTYTPTHFDPCAIVAPEDPNKALTLTVPGTYTYDTDTGSLRDPQNNPIEHANQVLMDSQPNIRLVSVDEFELGPDSTLRAFGSMPLLIASWSTITAYGTIDVSSSIVQGPGAGANTGTCNAATAGSQGSYGGGGGGGGGFGADGGAGGLGGGDGPGGAPGTTLGAPPANVRGGCPGAKGCAGDMNDGSGAGGAGGGALQLTAAQSIVVYGKLHAGGAGGGGANGDIGGNGQSRRSGGGGGGSGGMLGLEASMIQIGSNAILAANGGGGGGGIDYNTAESGEDGKLSDVKANRGYGDGKGGDGGDGGVIITLIGQPGQTTATGGGGGGGGSVGYIITSTTPTITGSPIFSPAYVTP